MSGSNADVSKMRAEDANSHEAAEATKRHPRPLSGGVLHQRRSLPFSPAVMAVGGFLFVATLGYVTLYYKSKPGTTPSEVAKIAMGTGERSK